MGWIERMADDTALGMRRTSRLDLAHGQARRARPDDRVGRQQLVELSIEPLLEIDPLGPILLDEIRTVHGGRKVRRKGQLRL
jgi:hypothetical protein